MFKLISKKEYNGIIETQQALIESQEYLLEENKQVKQQLRDALKSLEEINDKLFPKYFGGN